MRYRLFFLTLIAPSFEPTHHVPKLGLGTRKCRCGDMHDPAEDAGLRGVAIDHDRYDYGGCVRWNYGLWRLWDATRSRLSKSFPEASYAKVGEFQARGALHVHVIIRLPLSSSAFGSGLCDDLLDTCRSVVTREGLSWGQSAGDCQRMKTGDNQEQLVYYMTKVLAYVTKDAVTDGGAVSPGVREHFARLDPAARHMHCDRCQDWAEPCGGLPHRRWGARSSVLSKSRESKTHEAWSSLRRMDLRERRINFARFAEGCKVAMEALAQLVAEQGVSVEEGAVMLT